MGPSAEWQIGNCAEQQEKGFGPISCVTGLYSLIGTHCSLRPSMPSGSVNLIRCVPMTQLRSPSSSSGSSGSCQQLDIEEASENSVLLLIIPTPRLSTDLLKETHSYRILSKGKRKRKSKYLWEEVSAKGEARRSTSFCSLPPQVCGEPTPAQPYHFHC